MISFRESSGGSPDSGREDLASRLYSRLRTRLDPLAFETWFLDTPCTFHSPDVFVLTARNRFRQAWIRKEYSDLLVGAAREVCGFEPKLLIETGKSPLPAATEPPATPATDPSRAGAAPTSTCAPESRESPPASVRAETTCVGLPDGAARPKPPIQRELTFENFVVGKGANVPHAAALAVAEDPGTVYNPFYVYGPTGLGKTHLLQAIFHRIAETTHLRQVYVTCESFTNDFTHAVEQKELETFRRKYRAVDVFYFDDIQFLSTKSKTQEELFHTLQSLLSKKAQVVISGNSAPNELEGLHHKLASCFDGGLATPLTPPDLETRLRVLYRKASIRGFDLPVKTANLIAREVTGNLRELEGALKSLVSLSHLHGCPPTQEIASEAVNSILGEATSRPLAITVDAILRVIEEYYDVKQKDLLSSSKVRSVVYARQIGMYLARELTPLSLEQIGLRFGGKNHTTVLYGVGCVRSHQEKNPQLRAELRVLRERLTRAHSL